ncbi:site-specific recombinase, DNA invertase Pin [Rhizobium anhuiense]|uniref:Site-specific recombinase, DNA invertase Pin n=1 Tax=Rhizobium anhuiense TaxID=1184720 RepID=A0ABX4J9M2_9HYPH|nr:recombinase family protein [Rhizobium anhuiense]PDS45514.1 site-specific recombinase, DNA invertase Pin [Rhizobium anhuiense]PDS51455.1 site-specific recombinase, DNA invertase Pin [Rhizobium anhuiense]
MTMSKTRRPKAYSYIRFSTPEQMKGDSLRRQTAATALYAKTHGLDLDDKSFEDFGISAYRGANEETGRLGDFLEAIKHGDISKGSYLLVESLDRISRKTPRKAVRILEAICEAGITVVTLADQRVYTEETLDEDPMAIMYALMVAQRANEESAMKSRRLKQAWIGKRLNAATAPLTAICPAWLKLNDQRTAYDVIPERADVVRSIFAMCLEGLGQHSIATRLTETGIPTFKHSDMWHRSYVKKLLENPSVVGRFIPHTSSVVAGRKVRTPLEPVEGYFPAIVDVEVFEKVAAMSSRRGLNLSAGNTGTAAPANVLAGLAKCPTCGATMTRVNKGGRKGGKPYLVCTKAKAGAGCRYKQVKLEAIEEAVVSLGTYLHHLTPSPNAENEANYRDKLILAEVVEEQIQNLVEAVARGDTSKAVTKAITDHEAQLDHIRGELEELSQLAADAITNRIENTVADFCRLTEGGDIAKINATMRQLFDKAVVDYDAGYLRLYWRHTEQNPVEVLYTFVETA